MFFAPVLVYPYAIKEIFSKYHADYICYLKIGTYKTIKSNLPRKKLLLKKKTIILKTKRCLTSLKILKLIYIYVLTSPLFIII